MVGRCSRCGRKTDVEYAIDGRAYCSSCIFYANYRQCWKCQMYLPVAELQQYKGQWMCPYCLMDEREDDKKKNEYKERRYEKEPLYTTAIKYSETCQRCGRETDLLYSYNDRILCSSCLGEEQKKWGTVGGGPAATPYRIKQGEGKGVLAQMFEALLVALGIKKAEKKEKEPEIVAVKTKEGKKKKRKKKKGFRKKPMSEDIEEEAKGPFERYKKD